MSDPGKKRSEDKNPLLNTSVSPSNTQRRRSRRIVLGLAAALTASAMASLWIGKMAFDIRSHLVAALEVIPAIKEDVAGNRTSEALLGVEQLRTHTAAAKEIASSPAWSFASAIPGLGHNFSAVTEVAQTADDVAVRGLVPIANTFSSLDWKRALPSATGSDLKQLSEAAPQISSAAHAVRVSSERLDQIETSQLLPQIAQPVTEAREQLESVTGTLEAAADAANILPGLMGAEAPRSYLLMIQNNAESRASGGIPGALALLTVDNGKFSLSAQSSATEVGVMSPAVPVAPEQQQIYSSRLGKFMQDVNLTPDFPTAASTAQAMWERKTGERTDGVISIDPVALGFILKATGPVDISGPASTAVAAFGLPTRLDSNNVVPTLLSDVYAKIDEPRLQDAYFAGVAQEVFGALSKGDADPEGLLAAITHASTEGRILLWSAESTEQSIIAEYPFSGSVGGPSVLPAQFGVYFNDGTGAKMDYYVRRTVQLVRECPRDGYQETTLRITSTNTAPADAATTLPAYVTGDGVFGVPPGTVQTNISAYGPVQAQVETALVDGQQVSFAPYIHGNRPVGVYAIRLEPGESTTIEFRFGKIVQHAEPNVVVTPTVQSVKDVTLPTKNATCR